MTSRQESKLSMYLAVKDFLTANAAMTTTLPNYAGFFTSFGNAITQIQNHGEQQMFDKTGLQTNKAQLRGTLVTLAGDTSRKILAYARFANNQLLLTEAAFSESELRSAPDTRLRDYAQGIYDRAQSNLTALASYGVSATTQTALLNAITAFLAAIPKPRLATADKKQSTLQLSNGFNAADLALVNIDALVEIVKIPQPNFYNGYKTVRKIINTGTGSLQLQGVVLDSVSGEPIKGVTVMFSPNETTMAAKSMAMSGKPATTLVKKSADKGGFKVKSLPAGMYTVTVKKNGYAEQLETIAISEGEMTDLKIELSRN
jgi:hypothetical protein